MFNEGLSGAALLAPRDVVPIATAILPDVREQ